MCVLRHTQRTKGQWIKEKKKKGKKRKRVHMRVERKVSESRFESNTTRGGGQIGRMERTRRYSRGVDQSFLASQLA